MTTCAVLEVVLIQLMLITLCPVQCWRLVLQSKQPRLIIFHQPVLLVARQVV